MGLKEAGLRGSLRSVSTGVPPIPDSDIYLQDDWGDNKLTDRDDSRTTTYNGETGVYRPEWTIRNNEPTVSGSQLQMRGGDGIFTNINLNFDENIEWDFDISSMPDKGGGDLTTCALFAEQTDDAVEANGDDWLLHSSYSVLLRGASQGIDLERVDANGDRTVLISGEQGTDADVRVTRSASGEWELFIDGTSQGTATDTTFTSDEALAFLGRDDAEVDFNELKVS